MQMGESLETSPYSSSHSTSAESQNVLGVNLTELQRDVSIHKCFTMEVERIVTTDHVSSEAAQVTMMKFLDSPCISPIFRIITK